MPQEIPAICHPYKVTFSVRTVIYRQIIPTGSDAEHPVCASHSGLNLLTCLLTHQCAVIIPFPTHFTIFSSIFIIGSNIATCVEMSTVTMSTNLHVYYQIYALYFAIKGA